MSKQSKGMLATLTAIGAGAAAWFFSKEENREKAKKELSKVAAKARSMRKDVQAKTPKATQKLKKSGQKLAAQALATAKKTSTKKVSTAKKTVSKAVAKKKVAAKTTSTKKSASKKSPAKKPTSKKK